MWEINGEALYPFCLVKRSSLATLMIHIEQKQRSLKQCFSGLHTSGTF